MSGIAITVEKQITAFPLSLNLQQEGVGGISGQAPTVKVRRGSTTNSYLDFSDNAFKTSGWVLKEASMQEVGDGNYQRSLDIASLAVVKDDVLVAEYHVDDGGDVVGSALDLLIVTEFGFDLAFVRKSVTNRMATFAGTPGVLLLFDDDDSTVIGRWELRDSADGGIIATVASPAKRGKNQV